METKIDTLIEDLQRRSKAMFAALDELKKEQEEPKPKFKVGDWVRNKVSGNPYLFMGYEGDICRVECKGNELRFPEGVLEPYTPKKGEKVIAMSQIPTYAFISVYEKLLSEHAIEDEGYIHCVGGKIVKDVIPFISIEQYDKIIGSEKRDDNKSRWMMFRKEPNIGDLVIVREHMFPKEHAKIGILEDIGLESAIFRYKMDGKWYFEAIICESVEQYKQYLNSPR